MIKKRLDEKYLNEMKENGRLFIGNFEYYRTIEDEIRKDEKEAIDLYENNGKPITFEEIEEITRGSSIQIKSNSKDKKQLCFGPGIDVKISNALPNAFVFCTTGGEKTFGTNSSFIITNTEKFGSLILNELNKSYKIRAYSFDRVKYVESKNRNELGKEEKEHINFICNDGEVVNISLLKRLFNNYFTKEKKFEDEQEFRFVFLCDEQISKDEKKIITINTSELNGCIKWEQ